MNGYLYKIYYNKRNFLVDSYMFWNTFRVFSVSVFVCFQLAQVKWSQGVRAGILASGQCPVSRGHCGYVTMYHTLTGLCLHLTKVTSISSPPLGGISGPGKILKRVFNHVRLLDEYSDIQIYLNIFGRIYSFAKIFF